MAIDIEKLTVKELREISKLSGCCAQPETKPERVPLPFNVGDAILIRTVTMIDLGRVVAIGRDFITLEDGGWVADTARFSTMLETGALNEFERVPSWFLVGRGAICDVYPWPHALPKVTK
jgi:hypothetical protein